MLAKVMAVHQLQCREYTDKMNVQKVFKVKGLTLLASTGTFYAEGVQEMAELMEQMGVEINMCVFVQLASQAREYRAQNGTIRFSNELTIKQINLV